MSVPKASDRSVVVPAKWWEILPRKVYSTLERVKTSQSWFEVYRVDPTIYVIYEPYQFEEAISYLVLGKEKAALIDTGCGIADIRRCVGELTKLPVIVVNTHAHSDHVAQDYMFKEVAIFDGPMAREASRRGYDNAKMIHLVDEGMTWKPLPKGFDVKTYHVPPFKVTRWLHDGDVVDLGGRRLEVFHTPGHSDDSICMLERDARLFWTGDLFYTGGIYTYLPGGDIPTFIRSYKRMIDLMPHYDRLMPSHNEPLVEKEMLLKVYEAIRRIAEGKEKKYIEGMDGDIRVRRYNYDRFSIVTRVE